MGGRGLQASRFGVEGEGWRASCWPGLWPRCRGGGGGGGVDLKSYKAFLCPFGIAEDSRQSLCSRSPDAMGTRYFLVGFLILLVLGFETQGAHVPQQDEASSPALLTQVQESLLGYWDTAKAAAQKLYKKTYLPTVDEKIRDIYSKSTAAVTTYAGIITDQFFSMLSGED
ncbi:hypothetical protein FD754_011203 [Muntiacus muntjak]|uniref:Apolipoprotein C-II n=1 Tax=Muntiacus muntjak TaxID=9888 RepID=A0A5N3VDJ1_MUNMU|nr:hypothetical protein FD754_011203 [Muntiacus muntjak]